MVESVSCIIADDDEIDRLTTVSFMRRYPFLKIDGVFEHSAAVLAAMQYITPDVMFLDIDMPGLTGLALRDRLQHVPVCVFITSYAEYAVESFEKEAFDFLIKPLKHDRLAKTITRLQDYFTLHEKAALLDASLAGDAIFIKEGHDQVKIHLRDVLYLEALKDYTRIVTKAKKYCVLSPLGNLLKEESFKCFIRVHRSYAVQREYISKITSSHVLIKNHELPIGRSYKESLASI
jgi:two-component system, LytTR family, response regulator